MQEHASGSADPLPTPPAPGERGLPWIPGRDSGEDGEVRRLVKGRDRT